MFLMIDNYDSFVYNLVRYLQELDQKVLVHRNDCITIDAIKAMNIKGIVISPGPKTPKETGLSLDIIRNFKGKIPILGICLGHQAIGYAFGANIVKGAIPIHGKNSLVTHDGKGLFKGIKNPLSVTRYHSLEVERASLPDCLQVTCQTSEGVIMGIRHKDYCIEGVQFHPEAEMTECGHALLENFIDMCI